MKNLVLFVLANILLLLTSCDSSETTNNDTANNQQTENLLKIVTIQTYLNNPSQNTKNIKRFENFEVVSDSTFDYQNQFISRNTISINGLTKTYKSFLNNGTLTSHREENYDSQGRLVGRHTYEPVSALYFTYVYNNDGTVSSNYFNELDNQTTTFRTFTKNNDGLIFKENSSFFNTTTNQTENYEGNATLDGQKLISTNYSGTINTFQYYPNPMPSNMLKSVDKLNNLIIGGNELRYLAYYGNSYYKVDDNVITTFNSNNYITYTKSTNTNLNVTRESFYYYN
jgi:hypothetical protein